MKSRLLRKYIYLIMALVSGALVISAGIELYAAYRESTAALGRIQREKALGAAARIEDFVEGIVRQIGWTNEAQWGSRAVPPAERRFEYLRLLRQAPAITDLSLIDASGHEEVSVSRLGLDKLGSNRDFSADPKFVEAKAKGAYFSPIYFRKDTEPYMTIAVAGIGRDAGVTVAEVNLKFVWDVVSRIHVGEAGLAYVLDASGHLVAHPDISLVLRKLTLEGSEPLRAARARGPRAEEAMVATNLRGDRVLAAHAEIAPLGWLVFVEQPLGEAFAPIYAALWRTIGLLLVALLVAVAAGVAFARHLVRPILRIREGAAQIGAGALDHRIEVKTGDELEALASEFNRMAERLGDAYSGLERKVEERTTELTQSVAELQALREVGEAVSSTLDLHTVLTTIIIRAAELSGCEGGIIWEFHDATRTFHVIATHRTAPDHLEVLRAHPIRLGEGAIGKAGATGSPVQVSDILVESQSVASQVRPIITQLGIRSLLAIPFIRDQRLLGGLVVWRKSPGPFATDVVNLLQTFAAQSVLAIQNARLFREIQEKGQELEIANRHKSQFLSAMSHELRTPLNAIIGFSEALQARFFGELNAKQAEYVDDIHASGQHLLSLINDILDLSKIEAGRMELDVSRFEVAASVEQALALVRERAARADLELAIDVAPDVGSYAGDERKFRQILLNLLSNAIKFTPRGGQVRVSASRANGALQVAVTDTGIGIAPEDQAHLFEAFQRVGDRRQEGTGLGLTLTRKFVELHGGRLEVSSAPNRGSSFTVSLPLTS